MSRLFDMHVHTTSSPDAGIPEEELASRAAGEGLGGVGFVAHVDFHPMDYCVGAFRADGYDAAFARAAAEADPGIRLMKGIEVGEPHRFGDQIARATAGRSYDFVVGAVHWVGDRQILDPDPFLEGDPLELVEEYYRELLAVARRCDIDVLAHPGICRRGMCRAGLDTGFDETSLWPGLMTELVDTLVQRKIALEVNTSGLRRPEGVTYPTPRLLSHFVKLGGSLVTLGSDTHSDPWVFYGLAEGSRMIRDTGIGSITLFEGRKAVPVPLP